MTGRAGWRASQQVIAAFLAASTTAYSIVHLGYFLASLSVILTPMNLQALFHRVAYGLLGVLPHDRGRRAELTLQR